MSELNASNLRKEHGNEGPDLVGLTELTSPYFMVPPSGTTVERPQNPQPGTLRFNTDIGSLEYFKGDTIGWESINRVEPATTGGRGFPVGDEAPAAPNTIEYYSMETQGTALDWGDLTTTVGACAAVADAIRGVRLAGCSSYPSTFTNSIDYFSLASFGNALDFGDVSTARRGVGSFGDRTRGGCFGGATGSSGSYATTDAMDYVTIQSTGNAADFGDLSSITGLNGSSQWGSATRAMIGRMSSNVHPTSTLNRVDYVTVQTTGNTVDFGDITYAPDGNLTASNAVRGILAGGYQPSSLNTMCYCTIATTGNFADFGDLISTVGESSGVGGRTRAFFVRDYLNAKVDYVNIASTGNALAWGDLTTTKNHDSMLSNSHGGLG